MENSKLMVYNLTPDLLAREVIVQLLKDRCINLPNMNTMSKEVLVELFHRVIAPLPQRIINFKQIQSTPLLQQSRGFSIGFSDAKCSSSLETNSRLKPPPGDFSSKHKTVKLTTNESKFSSHLDKIIINDRTSKIKDVETEKSKKKNSFNSEKKVNALDNIIINDRTKKPVADNITDSTVELSESVIRAGELNTNQSVNSLKPRIKLKRSSLNDGNCQESTSTTHDMETQIKKPKTKIVF